MLLGLMDLSFICSENFTLILASRATFVSPLAGLVPSTVGAGRAAQAVPAAKSSARAIVVNSSMVRLISETAFPVVGRRNAYLLLHPVTSNSSNILLWEGNVCTPGHKVLRSTKEAPNFGELRQCEVRRTPIPRTWVNSA